ncbi:MAG: response regulator, partial [Gemmatimonadaceae bacterium]
MRPEPRIRVLVAEKEANALRLFQTAVSDLGWEVTARSTGASAVDCVRSELLDVVLTELDFPDVDGISLLREVRAQPSPAEVVILAADSPKESVLAAMRLGAYGYLSSPYEMA